MYYSYERNNIYLEKYIVPIILFIISLIIIWPYLRSGVIIGSGESAILINPSYANPFYLWNERINMGGFRAGQSAIALFFIFWKIFNIFSFWIHPSVVFIFLTFYLPGLFLYILLNQVMNFDNKLIFLPSCLLYSFNIFRITTSYQNECLSLLFVFLPLFFLFYHKLLEKKEWKYVFILILISIASSTMGNNFPIFIIPYFLLFIYLIFYIFTHKLLEIKKIFLLNIVFLLLAAIGNLFWIVPTLKNLFQLSQTLDVKDVWNAVIAGSFFDQFRYMGFWAWRSGWGYDLYFPFSVNYYKPILLITTFFISIFSLLYMFLMKHKLYKNIKNFLVLLTVFSYFLVSGAKGPLGFFYNYLYNDFVIFKIFREPYTKFMPLFIFATTIGLAFSVFYLSKVFKSRICLNIFIFIISLIILFNAYPLFTKQAIIFQRWNQIQAGHVLKIPKYWEEGISYLSKYKLDEQIFLLPYNFYGNSHNFEYGINVVGNLADFLLVENKFVRGWEVDNSNAGKIIKNLFENIDDINWQQFLGLLGSKRVLIQNDVEWRYSGGKIFSPSTVEKLIEKQKLNKVAEFGKFTKEYLAKIPNEEPNEKLHNEFYQELTGRPALALYEFDNQYFLPHFYIPQNVIYSNGEIEDLADVVSLGGYSIRSGIYLDGSKEEKEEDGNLIKRANEFFVEGKLENRVSEGWLKDTTVIDVKDIFFPYVRWKPGSLIYSLILKKEQFDEWRVRNDPEKLLDKKLFYASKRISEIERWGGEIDLNKAFERYETKIEEAMRLLKEDNWQDKRAFLMNILKTETYLKAHWEKIKDIGLDEERTEEANDVFEGLQEKVENLKPKDDFSKLVYNFEIPQEENYQLFIKNEEFSRYLIDSQLKLDFLGKEISLPLPSENENWISGGSYKLESGEQGLKLVKPQTANLLSADIWQENLAESIFVKNEIITALNLQLAFPEESTVYFKPIEDYQGDTSYRISFDYFAFGGEAKITVIEDVGIKRRELKIEEKLFRTSIDSPRHFEKVLKSTSGTKTAEFYFWGKPERNEDFRIELFNVKIEKVFEPTIILHATQQQKSLQIPKITFIKINPTKYRVKVEGAKEPYTLVFSESFDKGWKAYIDNTPILQYSNTPNIYGEVVASYFDGEIREGTHRNIFLDGNTFETLGRKSIPEERHYLVNGYANSWYITPEDAGGKENYEIIVEFWPQRLFYIGLGISLMTLLGCLGYLGYDFAKKKIRGRK